MATFELTSPQGQKYRVEGPEGATEQDALRQLQRQLAGLPIEQNLSAGDQAADVAKSGGIGVVKGAIGLAGAPADYGTQSKHLGGIIAEKLGISPETQSKIGTGFDWARRTGALGPIAALGTMTPGSGDIQSAVEQRTGKFYEPKTRAGRYAETVGSFVPSAVGGPGGFARRALTQAVIPGIASEAAGEATAGTDLEPYARMGAAAAGGFPFGRWRSVPRQGASAAPLAEELFDAGRHQYKQIRDLDLRIKPAPIASLATTIENDLTHQGLTRTNVPETYAVIDRLKKSPPAGGFVSATDFDSARQELLQATRSAANPREKAAAWPVIEQLDKYLSKIPAGDVIRGDAKAASELFQQARGNWAAGKRLEMLGGKLELGDLNAATAHSGMNRDNAIRQAVKQLIRPNKYGKTLAQQHGFSDREIAAMRDIARGTAATNTLRYIGNLLGGGGGFGQLAMGVAGAAAGYETGHPELMGIGLAGYGARRAAGAMTERQAQRLLEDVARRSPHGGGVLPRVPTDSARLLGLGALRADETNREHGPLRLTVHPKPRDYGGPQ
jgi:hypothetical protein